MSSYLRRSHLDYNGFDELNHLLAPEAETLAEKYCEGSYVDGQSCKWYHRSWLYLKQVQLVSRPSWHQVFYLESIKKSLCQFSGNSYRVLVCGVADFEMFAVTIKGLSLFKDINYEIFVFDICSTPLLITRRYADIKGSKLTLVKGDALRLPFVNDYFDLIITDAFLTRFSDKSKREVVNEWHRVLREHGTVITTARLEHKLSENKTVVANVIQRVNYVIRAATRAIIRGISPIDLARHSLIYSGRMASNPFGEVADVEKSLDAFEVQIAVTSTPGEMKQTPYACIQAKKTTL